VAAIRRSWLIELVKFNYLYDPHDRATLDAIAH